MAKKTRPQKENSVTVDIKAGSMAYNRLDMQASQALHMAIELYPNLNYLLVLDHYDDITLFEDDTAPETVSYYQMKTSEDSISIDTAISEEWIAKLYEHLSNSEWVLNELGLITNSPLRVTVKIQDSDGKTHTETQSYSSESTEFLKFNPIAVNKIKADIASRKGIAANDVDLSKFVHMRTTLSIPKHREIVEQEMGNFLQSQYPRITIDSAKAIYSSMMDLLTRRQSYELLDKKSNFSMVRAKKGVSKCDFSRIIDEAMLISIPEFSEIQRLAQYTYDIEGKAALEYTRMVEDFKRKTDSFTAIFLKTRDLCLKNPLDQSETITEYCERIYNLVPSKNPIYGKVYISVLTISILLNEERRIQ